ncbi:MAG: hypothetical protein C5S49_05225 [Candidatus Methanogaster sp.]|nr:MAG: hypothetical protein C5S49_05225 [ANME-2 cluster archaeon]
MGESVYFIRLERPSVTIVFKSMVLLVTVRISVYAPSATCFFLRFSSILLRSVMSTKVSSRTSSPSMLISVTVLMIGVSLPSFLRKIRSELSTCCPLSRIGHSFCCAGHRYSPQFLPSMISAFVTPAIFRAVSLTHLIFLSLPITTTPIGAFSRIVLVFPWAMRSASSIFLRSVMFLMKDNIASSPS